MTGRETALRWTVRGLVQGVGFRWFVARRANGLGLAGWVENLPNGSVLVTARGNAEALHELERTLNTGPSGANVESVEKSEIPHQTVSGKGFEIR